MTFAFAIILLPSLLVMLSGLKRL